MTLVAFNEIMEDAERGQYAVGYFESWNLESLLAVADAAEKHRSPVILGFSGIYLPHPDRKVRDRLAPYAAMGLETCDGLSVPACLLFNESPHMDWVIAALTLGFNLVMFSDDSLGDAERIREIRLVADRAHKLGAAVEAELESLPGVGGDYSDNGRHDFRMTDPADARGFVMQTNIDALAVNIGQVHVHGRRTVRLDLDQLKQFHDLSVPLVLHGATSVSRDDLRAAIQLGIRKINVGSLLKQVYFDALRDACATVGEWSNPYEVVGSRLESDVLVSGRIAIQNAVGELMQVFGSAGKAPTVERVK